VDKFQHKNSGCNIGNGAIGLSPKGLLSVQLDDGKTSILSDKKAGSADCHQMDRGHNSAIGRCLWG
jgi:hypothetical protein